MLHNLTHTGPTVQIATTSAAVTSVAVSWTDWLPPAMSVLATTLTSIYVAIQITVIIKHYLEKRELARGPKGRQGERGPKGDPGASALVIAPVEKPIIVAPVEK